MAKPSHTVEQLQALLLERIEAIPEPRGQVTEAGRFGWTRVTRTAGIGLCAWSPIAVRRSDIAYELQRWFELEG